MVGGHSSRRATEHPPARRATEHPPARQRPTAQCHDVVVARSKLSSNSPPKSQTEKYFIQKLQRDQAYNDSLVRLSIDVGLDEQFFRTALEPLSLCCLQQARELVDAHAPKLQQQVKDLQEQLRLCNLTAMKEISNMKAREREPAVTAADIDDIRFHEPLAYLDETTRELVMQIVLDKLNQLSDRVAPPELLESLQAAAKVAEKSARRNDIITRENVEDYQIEDVEDLLVEVDELREQAKRQEEMAMQQKIAMEQLLKESRDEEAQATAALESHQQEVDQMIQDKVQAELARMRSSGQDAQVQTELTSTSIQDMFEANAKIQAACAQLSKNLAKATGDADEWENGLRGREGFERKIQDSIDDFANAHSVFLRLWDDMLLRREGGHRRERAPAGPIPVKTFRPAKALPKPISTTSKARADNTETIPVYEEGRSSHHVSIEVNIEREDRESKPITPQVAPEELPVLPKTFTRQKKTVSLALLAPRARQDVESRYRPPLELLQSSNTDNTTENTITNTPTHKIEGLLETVSGFLKQRRQMHGENPTRLCMLPEQVAEGNAQPANRMRNGSYQVSRLGASKTPSLSTPALIRLT